MLQSDRWVTGERRTHEVTGVPDEGGIPGLADKLNHLFATVPKPGGGLHTNDTAAQALNDAGVSVSSVYLSHLRLGRRTNPSARLLAAIAQVFGVPIAYFFDNDLEEKVNADLATLASMRDNDVKGLMLKAHGLSRPNLRLLEELVDTIRKGEGLTSPGNEKP